MPLAQIEAGGIGFYDAWWLGAGADKIVAVNSPDDDSTSFIASSDVAGTAQTYTLGLHVIPVGSIINSVSVYSRLSGNWGPGTGSSRLRLGGVNADGPVNSPGVPYLSYTDLIGRPGGGIWSFLDLATLEFGMVKANAVWLHCTTLYLLVDWTAAGGGSGAVFGTRPLYPRARKRIIH